MIQILNNIQTMDQLLHSPGFFFVTEAILSTILKSFTFNLFFHRDNSVDSSEIIHF
jgi:hypothetical protein